MVAQAEAKRTVQAAVDAESGSTVTVNKATLQAAIGSPSAATVDRLYGYLVPGLIILTGLALIGIFALLINGKAPDLLLTAFTALLTGLLGLFIRSPQGS